MNLNEPCFDSVLSIDAQLQKLQTEVAQMDREFANYKPPMPRQTQNAAKSGTPSPEIEEERKTSTGKRPSTGRSVTFKQEQFPTGRDEMRREQMRQDELIQ